MDADPNPMDVDPIPTDIDHKTNLEDPREVAAKVEDERARILREGLKESENRLLSQTRSVEEMQELVEAIKDACRGISVAEKAAMELRESILIDAEPKNLTVLDSKCGALVEPSEGSDKLASDDKAAQKNKRNTKSSDDANITAWDELSDKAKDEIRADGEAEIAAYFKSNGKKELSFALRRQIREVQELLPKRLPPPPPSPYQFSTLSEKITSAVIIKNIAITTNTTVLEADTLSRDRHTKKTTKPTPNQVICIADAPSMSSWLKSMRDEVIPARLRAFIVQEYMKATCLKLEVLYGEDWGTTEYNRRIMNWQMTEMARILSRGEPEKVWVLVPRTPVAEA
ncbi:hypothetical protein BD779DRAFT_1676449 [Infundibulicybe gibba]|nr:hypothetical protein BD779DRAFT_1676449 [Infundibulicybe gibba]